MSATAAGQQQQVEAQLILSLALLSVRVVQGFIYWGGGSRRFIYDPSKLDPHAHSWMANKLQSAMPGAMFGTEHLIGFLLQHFFLLYATLLLFSAAELIAGVLLMAGLMTRAAAAASVLFSVMLMVTFGWQGATCIDEWTMAACNLAMGMTLMLGGGGSYALDGWILRRHPSLGRRKWFAWMAGAPVLPVTESTYRTMALLTFAAVLAFVVGTYSYYRGAVLTPYHEGPTNPSKHHLSLTNGSIAPDGGLRFHLYLDEGTPEAPAYIVRAELASGDGTLLESWDPTRLGHLPAEAIQNDFAYNQVKTAPFGLTASMGAAATVTLPASAAHAAGDNRDLLLRLVTVSGKQFSLPLASPK